MILGTFQQTKQKEQTMQTKINNRIFITKFFYSPLPEHYFVNGDRKVMKKGLSNRSKVVRETTCKVFEYIDGKLDETPVAEATMKCNPKDSYVKADGRFLAFRKAITTTPNKIVNSNLDVFMNSFVIQCSSSLNKMVQESLRATSK